MWQLATADPVQLRKWTSVVTMRTALELRGVACIGPEEDRTGRKDQLIVSRSFAEKITTSNLVRQALSIYAQQAATRLVKHSQVAQRLDAFASTSHWSDQRHSPTIQVSLPVPTADPIMLTKAAQRLLPAIHEGTRYARAGIILTGLLPAGANIPLEPFRSAHEDADTALIIDRIQDGRPRSHRARLRRITARSLMENEPNATDTQSYHPLDGTDYGALIN